MSSVLQPFSHQCLSCITVSSLYELKTLMNVLDWMNFCCGLSSWVCSIDCQQDMLAQMLILGWNEVEGFQVPNQG